MKVKETQEPSKEKKEKRSKLKVFLVIKRHLDSRYFPAAVFIGFADSPLCLRRASTLFKNSTRFFTLSPFRSNQMTTRHCVSDFTLFYDRICSSVSRFFVRNFQLF